MKKINFWDYCNTELQNLDDTTKFFSAGNLTYMLFILCIPTTLMILSPLFILYFLICSCFTKEVPDDYIVYGKETKNEKR